MAQLPAGMRNNNPGNIKYVGQAGTTPSVNTDQGDPQAVYATPEAGMRAMYELLLRKYTGGKLTPAAIIAAQGGWTPGNTQAAANVAATMGIGVNDDIGMKDPARAAKFMRALMTQEHGEASKAYTDQQINNAILTAPAPGVATPATSTGSAPAGTTLVNPTTNEVAPYKLGEALAPAVVINQQQSPFQYPVADANPFSSLGSAMAAGLDQGKAQFLSGGVNGGEVPPTPDFASAIPTAPNVDLPDIAGAEGDVSPLGSLFQVAAEGAIGKAGVPKLDQYGRPIGQPYYG